LSRISRVIVAWVIVCLLSLGGHKAGFTQADDALWSQPVNLSRSGAAESPVLVVGTDGQIQVFWWDRFDGLTTAYTQANEWSAPTLAPIQVIEGEGVRLISSTLTVMPQIVGVGETAFALWLGIPDRETGQRALLYSRLRLGTVVWTPPETLAESAIAWEMASDTQGMLHLVYCQTRQLDAYPAGIYYRRSVDGGITWSDPVALYASLYARLWTADMVHLALAADTSGNVLAGWDDPRRKKAFYVFSADGGLSWSEPVEVGEGGIVGLHPRFIALPALPGQEKPSGFVMLWERASAATTCILQQQRSIDGGKTWSAASRVFEELTSCPLQVAATRTKAGLLLLLQGKEASYLSVAAWDGTQWSAQKRLSFSFDNPLTGEKIYLEALQAAVTPDDALVAVGQEQEGDVWVLKGQIDAVEWTFAPPSPWSSPAIIAEGGALPGFPAVTIDHEGHAHVLWSAAPTTGQSGSVLYYSRWVETSWSRPVAVIGMEEGIAQSPALVYAEPFLHVVWSGGPTGAVFYSRSYPGDALTASSWSTPVMLSGSAAGSTPALTVDLLGRLHGVYAVPFNEGRGVYYLRTDDKGESWQEAVRLFDAAAEEWPSVDHPDVAVDEHGVIHVVWIRAPLPGYGLSQGVYYARSMDQGETWTNALLLANGAYDWPHIAATLTGQIVVTWEDMVNEVVEYRTSSDAGLTWDYASQIPGLSTVTGRVVLVQDKTGRLHITALEAQMNSDILLRHLVYTAGRWSSPDVVKVQGIHAPVEGVALAVAGEAGWVDVVGSGSRRADDERIPVLWHVRRAIEPQIAVTPDFPPAPVVTPTPGPTPAPTPTPRPVVNPYPPQPSAPVVALGPLSLPLLAFGGIGLAFLLVVLLVAIKVMKR